MRCSTRQTVHFPCLVMRTNLRGPAGAGSSTAEEHGHPLTLARVVRPTRGTTKGQATIQRPGVLGEGPQKRRHAQQQQGDGDQQESSGARQDARQVPRARAATATRRPPLEDKHHRRSRAKARWSACRLAGQGRARMVIGPGAGTALGWWTCSLGTAPACVSG